MAVSVPASRNKIPFQLDGEPPTTFYQLAE